MSDPTIPAGMKPDCARCGKPYWQHNVGAITTCPIIATYTPALSTPTTPDEARAREVLADSADYKRTFYGILNEDGAFWTPIAFADERAAKAHINAFFADRYQLEHALAKLTIVSVRSVVTLLNKGDR